MYKVILDNAGFKLYLKVCIYVTWMTPESCQALIFICYATYKVKLLSLPENSTQLAY